MRHAVERYQHERIEVARQEQDDERPDDGPHIKTAKRVVQHLIVPGDQRKTGGNARHGTGHTVDGAVVAGEDAQLDLLKHIRIVESDGSHITS